MAFALGPGVDGLVDGVESAEALRVGVFELVQLLLEQNVFFAHVSEDEGHFGLVGGVLEYGTEELVHPSKAEVRR